MVFEIVIVLLLGVIAVCMVTGKPLKIELRMDKDAKIQEVRPEPVVVQDEKDHEAQAAKQYVFDAMERVNNYLNEGVVDDGQQKRT